MVSLPVGSIRAIGMKASDGLVALGSWCAVNLIEGSWCAMPCAGVPFKAPFCASFRCSPPPSIWGISPVVSAVADRVRAMEVVGRSDATGAESLGDKIAEGEAVSVDSGPMRGTPLEGGVSIYWEKACHVKPWDM